MTARKDRAEIPPEHLAAARVTLAAWMSAQPTLRPRTVEPAELEGYVVRARGDWLMFSPPARANSVYLVSGDTVYSFAPAWETLEKALEKARALARR